MKNKINLFAMTQKGYEVAKTLIYEYKDILSIIVIGTDKAVDNDYSQELIALCRAENITYTLDRNKTKIPKNELIIAISWRWIIEHPEDKLVVFHDSLLPKYRGFAPLVAALINGDNEVGVTALFGAKEYDRGEIIKQSKKNIKYPIKIKQAIEDICDSYVELVTYIASLVSNNIEITSFKQNENNASYSLWRDDLDYVIDWRLGAGEIKRFVDATGYPYLGAKTYDQDGNGIIIKSVSIVRDILIEHRHSAVGKVIFIADGNPVIVCGYGLLKITSAFYEVDRNNYLPLKKFRTRFLGAV